MRGVEEIKRREKPMSDGWLKHRTKGKEEYFYPPQSRKSLSDVLL